MDEALFEGNVGPDTLLWSKPPNTVSQLFFLTEKCDFICSSQSTYGNGVFFSNHIQNCPSTTGECQCL